MASRHLRNASALRASSQIGFDPEKVTRTSSMLTVPHKTPKLCNFPPVNASNILSSAPHPNSYDMIFPTRFKMSPGCNTKFQTAGCQAYLMFPLQN
jgi:hypothetical protein